MLAMEKLISTNLITSAIAKGFTVSVFDGEEWTVKRSLDFDTIFDALDTTDMNILSFRNAEGESKGKVVLVWGNDGDLISDLSASLEIDDYGVVLDWTKSFH